MSRTRYCYGGHLRLNGEPDSLRSACPAKRLRDSSITLSLLLYLELAKVGCIWLFVIGLYSRCIMVRHIDKR